MVLCVLLVCPRQKKKRIVNDTREKLGVMIVEPQIQLLGELKQLVSKIWGHTEILPRVSAKECAYASLFLDFQVVLLRASVARTHPIISQALLEQAQRGAHIILLQDSAHKLSAGSWVSLGRLHFLSDAAPDHAVLRLLTACAIETIARR